MSSRVRVDDHGRRRRSGGPGSGSRRASRRRRPRRRRAPWPSRRPGRARSTPASAAPAGPPRARTPRVPPRRRSGGHRDGHASSRPASRLRRTAGSGTAGGRGDRLLHQGVERALPDLAGDQPAQPRLLGLGGPAEQLGDGGLPGLPASRRRTAPAIRSNARAPRAPSAIGDGGGGRAGLQPAPAQAGTTLPQRPGEVGRDRLDLVGAAARQRRRPAPPPWPCGSGSRRRRATSRPGRRAAEPASPRPDSSPPIRVRTSNSSGKNVRSSARRRKSTPVDPPVPVLWPIVRWTTWRCRNRHSWKLSSMSTSSSQVS